jgi:hypothetical protein
MKGPHVRHLYHCACHCLGLKSYLRDPGDGRLHPHIPAQSLLWSLLAGLLLRAFSFCRVEWLVRSPARAALEVARSFGDDALAYFTQRLDPQRTRLALAGALQQAKRNKAFENSRFIGLAIDGTGAGRTHKRPCWLCHPVKDKEGEPNGSLHHFAMVSVVGTGLTLPLDVEPYGPGDSEYAAGQRLLKRAVAHLGPRFADYVVADGEFATAPFLHLAGDVGLPVVARLKDNLPELHAAVRARFDGQPPHAVFQEGEDWVEVWDAEDFDPWEALRWETVRVMRYRQHKRDGTVFEADWLTDFPIRKLSTRSLYRIAKSRWEIENQGFNDGKNRYGMEHICHHEPNSLLIWWLLILVALVIERLYRLRYLHRGNHTVRSAINLMGYLGLSLCCPIDSS